MMTELTDLFEPDHFEQRDYIIRIYRTLLQRDPEPTVLPKLLERSDVAAFLPEILSSMEFRTQALKQDFSIGLRSLTPHPPRILLFGAYGNGNIGDKIQALSLRRAIHRVRPDVDVWASSVLPSAFPFPFDKVLPGSALTTPDILNQFDLLIIGGGGLLSHPHDPLGNPDWQRSIRIPVAVAGVGASDDVIARSEHLVRNAFYVSVRDSHSTPSMQRFVTNTRFQPDPVLCDAAYLSALPPPAASSGGQRRRLWILKPAPADQVALWQRMIDPATDDVCFIEPHLDFPLMLDLPFAKPVFDVEELLQLIDRSDAVISMRYHGSILAMLRGRPTVAIKEHKSLDLLRRYGNEAFFRPDFAEIPTDFSNYVSPASQLAEDQALFISEMQRILTCLPAPQPSGRA